MEGLVGGKLVLNLRYRKMGMVVRGDSKGVVY